MRLTNEQVLELNEVIHALSATAPAGGGQPGAPVFVIGPKARYAMAKNLNKFKPVIKEIVAEREAVNAALRAAGAGKTGAEKEQEIQAVQKDMTAKLTAFFKTEGEIDLHKFDLSDLNIEKNNNLTASLLAMLELMIEDKDEGGRMKDEAGVETTKAVPELAIVPKG